MNMKPKLYETDDRLSGLLAEWIAPEPASGFEAQVWRQIRQAVPVSTPYGAWWGVRTWGAPVVPLRFSMALALVCLAVGTFSGAVAGQREVSRRVMQSNPLLQPSTLTGAYVHMTAGRGF